MNKFSILRHQQKQIDVRTTEQDSLNMAWCFMQIISGFEKKKVLKKFYFKIVKHLYNKHIEMYVLTMYEFHFSFSFE